MRVVIISSPLQPYLPLPSIESATRSQQLGRMKEVCFAAWVWNRSPLGSEDNTTTKNGFCLFNSRKEEAPGSKSMQQEPCWIMDSVSRFLECQGKFHTDPSSNVCFTWIHPFSCLPDDDVTIDIKLANQTKISDNGDEQQSKATGEGKGQSASSKENKRSVSKY